MVFCWSDPGLGKSCFALFCPFDLFCSFVFSRFLSFFSFLFFCFHTELVADGRHPDLIYRQLDFFFCILFQPSLLPPPSEG
ncbi:hypothetical protein I7I48_00939 [Histoplasma ohiense]|nr:hypothetical protein I7I48_00939 [Histoplasma ohiense (nom. inval.)]